MKFGIFRKSSLFCLANIISRRVSIYACRKNRRVSIYAYRHSAKSIVNLYTARINPCPTAFFASLAKGGGTAKAVTEGLEKREEVNCYF